MKDGDVKVDTCIVRRARGTFAVSVRNGGGNVTATFPSLGEAQAFRDDVISKRPKRDYSFLGKKGRKGPDLISAMETELRFRARKEIAAAPRSTHVIDGREFTVVHLPPTARGVAVRDLRDPSFTGEAYLKARDMGVPIEHAILVPAPPYTDGGHISSDPTKHHSKVDQTLGNLDDGGAS